MAIIDMKRIRNIALLGHSGSGKTSLAEAMLYVSGGSDRLGKTAEGNSNFDYDPESVRRKISISAGFAPVMWKDVKINVIDTPGHPGFAGEVSQALRVADSAVIVIDAKAGIEVGTELAWDRATDAGLPKAIFINKFDDNEARFAKILDALHEKFGRKICPLTIPMIKDGEVCGALDLVDTEAHVFDNKGQHSVVPVPEESKESFDHFHEMLLEAIAGTNEELMEKYFGGEEISQTELEEAIHEGIIHNEIIPVFCGAATKLWGVWTLLDKITESFPRHTAKGVEAMENGDVMQINPDGEPAMFVFKTVADPFVGKMSFFKVMAGDLKKDMILRNTTNGQTEKFNKVFILRGKKQIDVDELACGDIGVVAKLSATGTNDTLTTLAENIKYAPIDFPKPYMSMAVYPASKGDEDKISGGIARILEEDLTVSYVNNSETKQLVLSGLGDIHLDIIVSKLKSRFGANVTLSKPRIAYRETIKGKADVEGKHKKQSGGSGQDGHVKIRFAPGEEEGLTFTESVFGGAVPKNFFPAVEQGLKDCMQKGILAGYPVVNLAAELYDGSYHDVDSNEISFKLAAAIAYREGLPKAKPVLLEPVAALKICVPDNYVGDVMGDLPKRRGRVLGIEPIEDGRGYQAVIAEAPMGEMADYVISLRAMTQGRGRFDMEFVRYEEVPGPIADKIIADSKKDA